MNAYNSWQDGLASYQAYSHFVDKEAPVEVDIAVDFAIIFYTEVIHGSPRVGLGLWCDGVPIDRRLKRDVLNGVLTIKDYPEFIKPSTYASLEVIAARLVIAEVVGSCAVKMSGESLMMVRLPTWDVAEQPDPPYPEPSPPPSLKWVLRKLEGTEGVMVWRLETT